MANLTDEEKEYYSLNQRVFRKLAPFYDFIAIPISNVRKQVVGFVSAEAGARVLDVATGTGKQAVAFARRSYDVIGIDLSDDMLEIARKKNKCTNLKFMHANATTLPFENNRFDVSVISFALHDMPTSIRNQALKEMVRVTRPTGMIVVVDYGLPRNEICRSLIYNIVKLYEAKTYVDFIKSDLKRLLSEAGVTIQIELSVVLGIGRVLKGVRA